MSEKRDYSRVTPPMGMGRKGGMGGPGPGKGRFQEKVKPKNTKETIFRLLQYIGKYKYFLLIALLFASASSILSILASYMIRPITNSIAEGVEATLLAKSLAMMALVYCIAVSSNYIQSRIMLEISQNSLAKIRFDLYNSMQRLPIGFFDRNKKGDLMSRFTNDVDIMNQMLSSTAISLVSGVLTLLTTVTLMIYTNWMLAIVTIMTAPILSRLTKFISKKAMVYYKDRQESLGKLNAYTEEYINGQKVIKVFNCEEQIIEEFQDLNKTYRDNSFFAQFLGGIMGPIMGSIAQFSYVLTACLGGIMCAMGKFDVGGLIVFMVYSKSFSRPVNEIFMQVNNVFTALAGAERVFGVMDQPQEIDDGNMMPDIKGEITFENVDFGYKRDQRVLHNISLCASKSQKVAFVGSTGAGKTTITNLLNRFYDIREGSIKIDGIDIRDIDKTYLRKNIAMVLQDTHLFTATIMENVRYGRLEASDEDVIEACKTANADKFIRRLENGYNTVITGDGASLSGGERQLLNIARAAISKAPILVLDEATSSVDTRTERHIQEALDRLMHSRTTFIIAHRLSTVRNSDKIIVLEGGEIIECGTHEENLNNQGKYYALYTGAEKLL